MASFPQASPPTPCAQRHATRTINESQTVEPHLAAGLEGRYLGNHSKQPQWEAVEKSRVPEVCLPQCRSGGRNLETTLQKAYVGTFFLVLWYRFGRTFFV